MESTHNTEYDVIRMTNDGCIDSGRNNGIIKKFMKCKTCSVVMKLVAKKEVVEEII